MSNTSRRIDCIPIKPRGGMLVYHKVTGDRARVLRRCPRMQAIRVKIIGSGRVGTWLDADSLILPADHTDREIAAAIERGLSIRQIRMRGIR